MKYSLRSSFARWVLILFFAILASTIAGRLVAITGASVYCEAFPFCAPDNSLGWLKLAHILSVGIAAILMLVVFHKAWTGQRGQRILLPMTTILTVMFFGQSLVGATQVLQDFPAHLRFLHQLTTISLWVSLLLLVYTSGVLATTGPSVESLSQRQRARDFFALSKPLIVGRARVCGESRQVCRWPATRETMSPACSDIGASSSSVSSPVRSSTSRLSR